MPGKYGLKLKLPVKKRRGGISVRSAAGHSCGVR